MAGHPRPLPAVQQQEHQRQVREGMFRDAVEACWKRLGQEVLTSDMLTDVYFAVFGAAFPPDTEPVDETAMAYFINFFRRACARRFGLPY